VPWRRPPREHARHPVRPRLLPIRYRFPAGHPRPRSSAAPKPKDDGRRLSQAATGTCSRRFSALAAAAVAVGVGGPPLPPLVRASKARVGIGSASGAGLVENPGPANTVELGLVERADLPTEPEDLCAGTGLALTTRACCVIPSLRTASAQVVSASEQPRRARYIPACCERAVYRHQPQTYVAWTPQRHTSHQPSTAT